MKIITDEILHLYVLNPRLVQDDLLSEIERNITISADFRERIEKIKSFYVEFEKVSNAEFENEQIAKKENIIVLYPQNFNNKENSSFVKLAADSAKELPDAFKYVKTFACAKTFILMRLHYNPAKKVYKLYLISENKNDIANVKVRIPELSLEFNSDSNGIVDLKNNNITEVSFVIIER
jgi:hypothetical protein